MTSEQYKELSISEFTKAAERYESNHAGIYEMCKKDYPDILEELEREEFSSLSKSSGIFQQCKKMSSSRGKIDSS